MSAREYLEYQVAKAQRDAKKGGKYANKWVLYDGINFQSTAEKERYAVLKMQQQRGEIKGFKRQYLFRFIINNVQITTYRCDFVVYTNEGGHRVEDVKGFITDEYLMKKRLLKALYGFEIYEPNLAFPATKRTRKRKF